MTWHDDHVTIGRPWQMEKAQDSWDSFIQGTAYVNWLRELECRASTNLVMHDACRFQWFRSLRLYTMTITRKIQFRHYQTSPACAQDFHPEQQLWWRNSDSHYYVMVDWSVIMKEEEGVEQRWLVSRIVPRCIRNIKQKWTSKKVIPHCAHILWNMFVLTQVAVEGKV